MTATNFDPTRITWASLLGRWIDFARSVVALSDDDPLRTSVADIIMLQAVWFALKHLDDLDPDERALGLDRAQVLIDKHTAAIKNAWRDHPIPDQLSELIRDITEAGGIHAPGPPAPPAPPPPVTIRSPSPPKGSEP